ncbi:MAG: hypothetical protein WCJ25_05310 [Candidatus Moraniibacteriota bacterium]
MTRRLKIPVPFQKNRHGHYVIPIVGKALNGCKEYDLLSRLGTVGDGATTVLACHEQGTGRNGYDEDHILEEGKWYWVALIPASDGRYLQFHDEERLRHFGYARPRAGIMPRLMETLPMKLMEKLGIFTLIGLHVPILNPKHSYEKDLLSLNRNEGFPWMEYGYLEAYADHTLGQVMMLHYQGTFLSGADCHFAVIDSVGESV